MAARVFHWIWSYIIIMIPYLLVQSHQIPNEFPCWSTISHANHAMRPLSNSTEKVPSKPLLLAIWGCILGFPMISKWTWHYLTYVCDVAWNMLELWNNYEAGSSRWTPSLKLWFKKEITHIWHHTIGVFKMMGGWDDLGRCMTMRNYLDLSSPTILDSFGKYSTLTKSGKELVSVEQVIRESAFKCDWFRSWSILQFWWIPTSLLYMCVHNIYIYIYTHIKDYQSSYIIEVRNQKSLGVTSSQQNKQE